MHNHALMHVEERKEVMGLMLGSIFRHAGREYRCAMWPPNLDATEVSVRFDAMRSRSCSPALMISGSGM